MIGRYLRFPGGKSKAVTFSYDDGVTADVRFSDLLTKYNLKGTFNLNGEGLRDSGVMTRDEVIEHILNKGHEIAVHGYFHRAEGMLRPIEGIREVLDCRLELEAKYGVIIRGMAYPNWGITQFTNSVTYDMVKTYLNELEIAYARSLGADNNLFRLPNDWHNWIPTAHHNNPQIMEYIDKFLAIDMDKIPDYYNREPSLFYLWGHSYEFDNNNNWDHAEEICKKLSGKSDTWYATNIEIYDYVKAYQSLVYSADGLTVYNPTAKDIWFDTDGKITCVKSRETIRIDYVYKKI